MNESDTNHCMLLLQSQQTPLHLLSENGHVDIVNVLLSHGANIHVKNKVSIYSDITGIKILLLI